MNPTFLNILPVGDRGIVVAKTVIRVDGSLKNQLVVGIACNYSCKDAAKEWAKSYDGGWNNIEKIWYAPVTNGNQIPDLIRTAIASVPSITYGHTVKIFCPSLPENLKTIIEGSFDRTEFKSNSENWGDVKNVFQVESDDESYNEHRQFLQVIIDDDEAIFNAQYQGYITIEGSIQRVVLFERDPEIEDGLGGESRQFIGKDGLPVWAIPWVNQQDRYAFAIWNTPQRVSPEDADLSIFLIRNKETSEPIGFKCSIRKGANDFWAHKNFCSQWKDSTWNPNTKKWTLPYGDAVIEGIEIQSKSFDSIYLSDGVIEILDSTKNSGV